MDETLNIFFIEATELLQEMETALMRLDSAPDDQEAFNSVFRSVHTIKGSAGIVDFEDMESFAHMVENLLDSIRDGLLQPTGQTIKLLLECKDHIGQMLITLIEGKEISVHLMKSGIKLLDRIRAAQQSLAAATGGDGASCRSAEDLFVKYPGSPPALTDKWHISLRFRPETFIDGMDPMNFISALEKKAEVVALRTITEGIPAAKDMDPESCYLGFEINARGKDLSHALIEDVFSFVMDDCNITALPPRSPLQAYHDLIGSLPESDSMLREIFIMCGTLMPEEARVTSMEDDLTQKAAEGAQEQGPAASTIRVDVEKLNRLLDTVGELVISGAAIKNEIGKSRNPALRAITDNLMRQIDQVRDDTMSVRMTPVQDTFNRFRRMVHDICADTGKEIDLLISGGETELDRTVIERIKDPLVHLVRNAADHGIEMPAARMRSGKGARGAIHLRAYQETGEIVIEVSDNGKGMDPADIKAKALAKGIIENAEGISDPEALELVFAPGFSTADEITSLSGRGVGMDVVRSNIEALKGSVSIESAPSEGTTVRVRLPLTLAIIDGFLVKVQQTFFVVPMDAMQECIELSAEAKQEAGRRNHINLRGSVLPYINLRRHFSIGGDVPGTEHVLVVRSGKGSIGLLVDTLVGEVHTVIKSLGKYYADVKGLSGATIMGDGTVALILDVQSLVKQALKESEGH